MKLFMFFYKIHKLCKEHEETAGTMKKRAVWALLTGFSKAGVYYLS